MGRTKVIFISCVILVLYLVCMYHVGTPNTRFSDPLSFQSVKQTEKENVSPGTVNLRKSSLDQSVLLTSKHQQNYMGNQNEASTSRKESNLPDGKTVLKKDKDMTATELAHELEKKIEAIPVNHLLPKRFTETCSPKEIKAGGCGGASKCKYRTKLPESYEDRINQLVLNKRLQIQPDHLKVIQSMGDQFKKRPKFLIVTGASSNHYLEIQSMIHYIHQNLSQDLNYELIVYDLGLATGERNMMEKFCKCTVITFPFSAFPEHVKELHCYSWKAPIVYAHSRHADVVMWADASVRFKKDTAFRDALQWTKEHGILQLIGGGPLAIFTVAQMFHYFNDEPCVYKPYSQMQSGAGIYHNEPFVRQAILAPWVGCALKQDCMCPKPPKEIISCRVTGPRWEMPYSTCHRFDQSALSIILTKLYQRAINYINISNKKSFEIRRRDRANYFDQLNNRSLHTDVNNSSALGHKSKVNSNE